MKNILKKIFEVKNENNHKIVTFFGIKISFRNKTAKENIVNSCETDCIQLLKRITPRPNLTGFVVDIVDHCNLNCKGCDHFSPLAKEKFLELQNFENDLKRLNELTEGNIDYIGLMGGEPLLHPQINSFTKLARNYFKTSKIKIYTNAINLMNMNEDFWQTCSDNNIIIEITRYPIKIDFDKINNTAEKYNITVEYYGGFDKILKTSYKIPLDLKGEQDPVENFLHCFHANQCIFLRDGKIYPCTVAPNIYRFNEYFNKNIPLCPGDGIDIYKVKSIDEITGFIAKPIPFCKYCDVQNRSFNHKWSVSKKDINEWIEE